MRTFPRALATLRELVARRGDRLRTVSFAELRQMSSTSIERVTVDSRAATIATIVEAREDGTLRVVLQGLMKPMLLPIGRHVALDGFYKHPDESVTPMPDQEFHEFE